MADDLTETNLPLVRRRALVDEDRNLYPMAALTDAKGKQTGTHAKPFPVVSVNAEVFAELVVQQRITNMYLAEIHGTVFTEEDL